MTFRTDCFADLIASAALLFTFAMILKTVTAVVTQLVIVVTGAAITAVMLLITGIPCTLSTMVTVFTLPVIITP